MHPNAIVCASVSKAVRRNRRVQMSLVVWLLLFGVGRSELPDFAPGVPRQEQEKLLAEYRMNYLRLKEFYGAITMQCIRRQSRFKAWERQGNPEGRKSQRLLYRAREGSCFRMDITPLDVEGELPKEPSVVRLVRPEGFVVASRKSEDQPYVINNWGSNVEEEISRLAGRYYFQWAPYSTDAIDLKFYFLQRFGDQIAKSHVVRFLAHDEGTQPMVTMTAEVIFAGSSQRCRVTATVYRDLSWAAKETSFLVTEGDGTISRVRRSRKLYDGLEDGVPLLKAVECWQELGPERVRRNVHAYEVTRVKTGPAPEKHFTLAALGLGNLGEQPSVWPRVLIFLLSAVFLLAIYFTIRRATGSQD